MMGGATHRLPAQRCTRGRHGLLALMISALVSSTSAATPSLVISDKPSHALAAEVFGQFLERPSWNGEFGPEAVCDADGKLPAPVVEALREMHAPVVRFPFGTAGDYIDWQDMIDLPGRSSRPESTDHLGNKVGNRFGFPEFFDLAGRAGWRIILVANLRDALYGKKTPAEAAAHAAALLQYALELTAPGSIAAFQVGNEGWFYWPPRPEDREPTGVTSTEVAVARLRECLVAYADAARAVDPAIPLICDAPRPDDGGGLENNAGRVWRMAVDHPDIRSRYALLAAHAYAPMGFWTVTRGGEKLRPEDLTQDEVWAGMVATPGRFDDAGQSIADATGYDDIAALGYRAAVTEWNWNGWDSASKFPQAEFLDGVPAALGAAGFLHGLMRHPHVALATQSMLLGTKWGITSVRVLPDGTVRHNPQAEPVRLYAEHHGSHVLECELKDVPVIPRPVSFAAWWPQVDRIALIDAVVTADRDRILVHLINRHRTEHLPLGIQLPPNAEPVSPAQWIVLTGDSAALTTTGSGRMQRSVHEVPISGNSLSLSLPPASVSVLRAARAVSRHAPLNHSNN